MAKKITFRSGNTTLNMSNEIEEMANNLVNKLLPDTRKKIEDELDRIKAEARAKWLVRKTKAISAEQQTERVFKALTKKAGKTVKEAKSIIADMKKKGSLQGRESKQSLASKHSKHKIYVEMVLTSNFELIGLIGNRAEYAWAIKVGEDTQNTGLEEGKRLAQGLLVSPVRKNANKFANVLANEIGKKIGG